MLSPNAIARYNGYLAHSDSSESYSQDPSLIVYHPPKKIPISLAFSSTQAPWTPVCILNSHSSFHIVLSSSNTMPKQAYNARKSWGETTKRRSRAKVYRIGGKDVIAPLSLIRPQASVQRWNNGQAANYKQTTDLTYEDDPPSEPLPMESENASMPTRVRKKGSVKLKRNEDWHRARKDLLNHLRHYLYLNVSTCAGIDCHELATIWCINCNDLGPMCPNCAKSLHKRPEARTHICRIAKNMDGTVIWEATPTPPWGEEILIACAQGEHGNTSRRIRLMQTEGQQHRNIIYCKCHTLNSALISVGYWPTSPKRCHR